MDWKKYQAPNLTTDFIDYLVQRILKKERPLYHIIHIIKTNYRRDIHYDSTSSIIEIFESSIKDRSRNRQTYVEFEYIEDTLPDFKNPPSKHTIVLCMQLDETINDCRNIGIVYDNFKYSMKHTILSKLSGEQHDEIELYTNLFFFKQKEKQKEKKVEKPEMTINNSKPRPECVMSAYKKKNTIIYEIVNLYKKNGFDSLTLDCLSNQVPSIRINNYTTWNKKHAQYDILYKTENGYKLHDHIIELFRKL